MWGRKQPPPPPKPPKGRTIEVHRTGSHLMLTFENIVDVTESSGFMHFHRFNGFDSCGGRRWLLVAQVAADTVLFWEEKKEVT